MSLNPIIVHHRSGHHAENSGYGRLIDYIDAEVVYGKPQFPFRFWKFVADVHPQNAGMYDAGSIFKTLMLNNILKTCKDEINIVHFLNGERDIRHLGYLKRKFPNTFFCATFHKPPKILKDTITDVSALKKLDGAIAVGANQVEFLKDWLSLKDVEYIPHGVDTGYFKPNLDLKENKTLLFVGQHLRDFEIFNRTIPRLVNVVKDLKIKVVIHPAYVSNILPNTQIEILTNVSDADLLQLYQQATILYLPLQDSTACNSILEAMACGLPIVTSKVGGNMAYLEGSLNIMVDNMDTDIFIAKIVSLLSDYPRLTEMGKTSRDKGLELDWVNTANHIRSFYHNLQLGRER